MTKEFELANQETAEAFAKSLEAVVNEAVARLTPEKQFHIAAAINAGKAFLAVTVSLEEPVKARVLCQGHDGELVSDIGTLTIEHDIRPALLN